MAEESVDAVDAEPVEGGVVDGGSDEDAQDEGAGQGEERREVGAVQPAQQTDVLVPVAAVVVCLCSILAFSLMYSQDVDTGAPRPPVGAGGQPPQPDMDRSDARFFGGRKVRDMQLRMPVSLADMYSGRAFEVEIQRTEVCDLCHGNGADPDAGMVQCPHCNGQGVQVFLQRFGHHTQRVRSRCNHCGGRGSSPGKACPKCGGRGSRTVKHALKVAIEPGVADGHPLHFVGEGNQHPEAANGDVILFLQEEGDHTYQRDGHQLRAAVTVTLQEALLGFSRTLQHLDGLPVTVSRTDVVQPGQVLRLEGKGMPIFNTNKRGDLLLTVNVVMPARLTPQQKQLVDELFPE